jgi:NCS1 family nucleobase:cation symporter-1
MVAPFFVAAGGVMAIAMFVKTGVYSEDPTQMLATLAGPGFSLLSLLLVAFANIGTQGTGSYVNCMIVKSGLPNIKYKTLVWIAFVYVSLLTVWGWVMENFGSFISLAAFIQGPIIGMITVDYLIVKKRRLSLKSAYYLDGHHAYDFTHGFNLVGIACVIIAFTVSMAFVYNPLTVGIKSSIFLVTTGSGFTAIFGGLLYWLASLTPLRKYMLRDRDDLEVV